MMYPRKKALKKIIKATVVFLFPVLAACATDEIQGQQQGASNLVKPVPDKAISMTVPQAVETAYSLYGIELGENRASVEKKYNLVGCRKDIFYVRCAVLLETSGVTGVSASDTTTVFIVFENDRVREMSVPVFPASFQQSLEMLNRIYGRPVNTVDKQSTWSNLSGSIVLEENSNKAKPSLLKFSTE